MNAPISIHKDTLIPLGVLFAAVIAVAVGAFKVAFVLSEINYRIAVIEAKLDSVVTIQELEVWRWQLGNKNPALIIPETRSYRNDNRASDAGAKP